MEVDEAKIKNNRYANFFINSIILAGLFLVAYFLNTIFNFAGNGMWLLEVGILFLLISGWFFYKLNKIRKILKKLN